MNADFGIEALEEAMAASSPAGDLQLRPGQPVHQSASDRGPPRGRREGPVDGEGRRMDTVSFERLWRSLNRECLCPTPSRPAPTGAPGSAGWSLSCNAEWPHSKSAPLERADRFDPPSAQADRL